MDDTRKKSELRKRLQKELNQTEIPSKYVPHYPMNAERQYKNLVEQYGAGAKKWMRDQINQMEDTANFYTGDENDFAAAKTEKQKRKLRRRRRFEHLGAWVDEMDVFFAAALATVASEKSETDSRIRASQIYDSIAKHNQSEWERAVKDTIGEAVPPESYYGELLMPTRETWVDDNASWLSGIPAELISDVKESAYEAYVDGCSTEEITDRVKERFTSTQNRQKALVINRVSNINTEITKQKHLDAGIHNYIWWTRMDEKVRPSHARLHGKRFSWADPPETDGGRRCHPGEDYGCRCTAIPCFDLKTIEL